MRLQTDEYLYFDGNFIRQFDGYLFQPGEVWYWTHALPLRSGKQK
jgi:hypothetical protein